MSTKKREVSISHQDAIVRASKVKELIAKHLVARGGSPSLRDISNELAESLDALGYDRRNLRSLLTTMVKAGMLSEVGTGIHREYVMESSLPGIKVEKVRKKAIDALQIDIIKATGRVRLSIQGLVIEIGVV